MQSDPANLVNILYGGANAQYVVLTPGQSATIPVINPSVIFVKTASSTATINWITRD